MHWIVTIKAESDVLLHYCFWKCWTITKACCCVLVDKKEGFGQGCDEQLVVCTPAGGVLAMKFLNLILSDGLFFP